MLQLVIMSSWREAPEKQEMKLCVLEATQLILLQAIACGEFICATDPKLALKTYLEFEADLFHSNSYNYKVSIGFPINFWFYILHAQRARSAFSRKQLRELIALRLVQEDVALAAG